MRKKILSRARLWGEPSASVPRVHVQGAFCGGMCGSRAVAQADVCVPTLGNPVATRPWWVGKHLGISTVSITLQEKACDATALSNEGKRWVLGMATNAWVQEMGLDVAARAYVKVMRGDVVIEAYLHSLDAAVEATMDFGWN